MKSGKKKLHIIDVLATAGILIGVVAVFYFGLYSIKNTAPEADASIIIPEYYSQPIKLTRGEDKMTVIPMSGAKVKGEQGEEENQYIYREVYPETDIFYTDKGRIVKEDIIFHEPGHPTEFTYKIDNIEEFTTERNAHGDMIFYKKDDSDIPQELKRAFTIPAPFVTDAEGRKSYAAVTMKLIQDRLVLTINKDWLGHAKYPIKLDPTIEINTINVSKNKPNEETWEITFATDGIADLTISPHDEITKKFLELTSLTCNEQQLTPEEKENNTIYFPLWQCAGTGKAVFNIKKKGIHILDFNFGDEIAYAVDPTMPEKNMVNGKEAFTYHNEVTTDPATRMKKISILAYPKYYIDDETGNWAEYDPSFQPSTREGYNWEITKGVYQLWVKNDGTFTFKHYDDERTLQLGSTVLIDQATGEELSSEQIDLTSVTPTNHGDYLEWKLANGMTYQVKYIPDQLKDIILIPETLQDHYTSDSFTKGADKQNKAIGFKYNTKTEKEGTIEEMPLDGENNINFRDKITGRVIHNIISAQTEPKDADPMLQDGMFQRVREVKANSFIDYASIESLETGKGEVKFNATVTFGDQSGTTYFGTQDDGGESVLSPNNNRGNSPFTIGAWNFFGANIFSGYMAFDLDSFNDVYPSTEIWHATLSLQQKTNLNIDQYVAVYAALQDWGTPPGDNWDVGDGDKDNTTAALGQPCYTYRQYNTVTWNTAGAMDEESGVLGDYIDDDGGDYDGTNDRGYAYVSLNYLDDVNDTIYPFDFNSLGKRVIKVQKENPGYRFGFIVRGNASAGTSNWANMYNSEDTVAKRPLMEIDFYEEPIIISAIATTTTIGRVANSVNFGVDWDYDGPGVKMLVCKTNAITPSATAPSCPGGEWCSNKNDWDTANPIYCSFNVDEKTPGLINYWVFVCTPWVASPLCTDAFIGNVAIAKGNIIPDHASTTLVTSHNNAYTDGLVGYWTFNSLDMDWETQRALDVSGNNRYGTTTNMSTSTSPVPGMVGKALDFDGNDDFVDIADDDAFSFTDKADNDKPFSISVWVKSNDFSFSSPIVTKYGGGGDEWYLWYTGNTIYSRLFRDSASAYVGKYSAAILEQYDGKWVHIVTTYDGSETNEGIKIWVNGEKVSTTNSGGGSYTGIINTSQNVNIGTASGVFADAIIDEVRIYNYELATSTIQGLYNLESSRMTIVGN